MAKFKYGFDEAKIKRFIAQGRGKGEGASYRPWLTIQDVPSEGRSRRTFSSKTGRHHELLSDLEKYAFLFYEWNDEVTDIREQYPLDREVTLRIASELGINHPKDPNSKCNIVMTTDLLVFVSNDNKTNSVARSIKPEGKLDKRVIDKLEIERKYWVDQGVDWGLITDKQLPKTYALNLDMAKEVATFDGRNGLYPNYWEDACESVLATLKQHPGLPISALCNLLQIESADVLITVRHLIWHKKISIDMYQAFALDAITSNIELTLSEHVRNVA